MKKRIAAFLLSVVLFVALLAPLAPQVQAATVSSYEPQAMISYDYSPNVVCGTIRYISQKPGTSKYYSKYWGKYEDRASYNCSTSCISMALSYIGIDTTPADVLDYNIHTAFMAKYGGSTPKSYTYDKLSTAVDNYISGNGKYSPPVIHLDKYSADGHYVMLIGRISNNVYQVLDPATLSIWSITISGSKATYKSLSSGSTITDSIDNTGTEDVYQWYNGNAKLMEDVTVRYGNNAEVKVYASGDNVNYTWYYADNGSSSFKKADGMNTATYSVKMTDECNGRKVYCRISDKNGNSIDSNTVTLHQILELGIKTQPKSVQTVVGGKATVTVEARGEGLTYTWYYANKGASTFTKDTSCKSNTYSLTMSASNDGRRVYCVVSDKYGDSITTDVATMSIGNPTGDANATVKVTSVLCIRSGAGTGYGIVGSYKNGARIEILEQKTVGSTTWGKTSKGWVSMSYVKMDSDGGSTGGSTSGSTTSKTNATIKSSNGLKIRSGAGSGYSVAGYYYDGDRVEILEKKTAGGITWGKTSKGWVSMAYVKLDVGVSITDSTPGSSTNTTKTNATIKSSSGLKIRSGAGSSYSVAGYYYNGDRVEILEKKTAGGITWGKTSKGWVSLAYVNLDAGISVPDTSTSGGSTSGSTSGGSTSGSTTTSKTNATVKSSSGLKIRSGAGSSHNVVAYYYDGDRVEILEKKTAGGITWGKTSKGWVSLAYVKLDAGISVPDTTTSGGSTSGSTSGGSTPGSTSGSTTSKPNATIKTSSGLKIRSGAGSSYSVVGYYYSGDRVEILEKKVVGSTTWGKTAKGWVSMDYVKMDSGSTSSGSTSGSTSSGSTSGGTSGSTSSGSTSGSTSSGSTTTSKPNATIKTSSGLKIRSGAGSSYSVVGYYYSGDRVEILEKKVVGSTTWGKTAKGWVSMDYVKMDSSSTSSGSTSGSTSSGSTSGSTSSGSTSGGTSSGSTTTSKLNATIKTDSGLKIRSGAGSSYSVVGYYYSGDRVEILEKKVVGSTTWGKTAKGWVSMDYVKMDSSSTSVSTGTKTVNTTCLLVRDTASSSGKVVGYLYQGDKVTITETKTAGGYTWGKCSKGWIALQYTK